MPDSPPSVFLYNSACLPVLLLYNNQPPINAATCTNIYFIARSNCNLHYGRISYVINTSSVNAHGIYNVSCFTDTFLIPQHHPGQYMIYLPTQQRLQEQVYFLDMPVLLEVLMLQVFKLVPRNISQLRPAKCVFYQRYYLQLTLWTNLVCGQYYWCECI